MLLLDSVQIVSHTFFCLNAINVKKHRALFCIAMALSLLVLTATLNEFEMFFALKSTLFFLYVFVVTFFCSNKSVKKGLLVAGGFMATAVAAEVVASLLIYTTFLNTHVLMWDLVAVEIPSDIFLWIAKTVANLVSVSLLVIIFSCRAKVPMANKIKTVLLTLTVTSIEFFSIVILMKTGSTENFQIVIPIIALASIVPFLIYYICVQDMKRVQEYAEKDMQTRFAELKSEQVMDYYHLASKYIRTAHTMRHDMANEIQCLKVLMETDREKSMQFVDEMKSSLKSVDKGFHTGFSVVDVLLTIKSDLAEEQAVPMDIAVHKINVSHIAEVDLCNLLSNILDNAIEASVKLPKELRQVCFQIDTVGQYLVIRCENNYDGMLHRTNDQFLTSKADKKGHGYGLSIIKGIAEKYRGESSVETTDQTFVIITTLHVNGTGEVTT